jgi:probable F420-dependent oxidoreductase
VQLAVLLAATKRLVFGTCIANVWARPAQTNACRSCPVGPGLSRQDCGWPRVGYPAQAASVGQEFGSPLATMRDHLDRMDGPTWPPAPDVVYPRIIAANGPKMLGLAGEVADGAMPAGLPAEFTAQAREVLGPDKLLVVGLSVVGDFNADLAKTTARQTVSSRLSEPSYAARIAGVGYSAQEIAEVSDRLVDAIVAHGDPGAIAVKVREHLLAGADHVTLLPPIGAEFAAGIDELEQVAPALTERV